MPQALTRGLAEFVAAPGFDAVPDDVLPLIRTGFIDTIATLLSGRDEPVTRAALAFAAARGRSEEAPVLLGTARGDVGPAAAARLAACDAAFVDAVSAHALDYDDMALSGHPSVVLVPALLAAGAAKPRAPGGSTDGAADAAATDAALLRAYLVGYEVWAELVGREPDALHNKGWHPTCTIGTVAVAAAVAHLRGLDAATAANALGIAASLSCGLMGNFGSMTKPLHAGWAAGHGIEAATLAALGVTAQGNILESPTGFLAAFSPAGRAERGALADGRELQIRRNGLSIKKYPICYASHRVVDGLLDLRTQHAPAPEGVEKIVATISDVNARVLHSHAPATALEGKFSLEFACALALVDGGVGLREVTDAALRRPEIRDAMARVEIRTVPAGCPVEPSFALHDSVALRMRDGTLLDSGPIRFARGHARLPLDAGGLRTKFLGCAAPHESARAQALYDALSAMGTGAPRAAFAALAAFAAGR